MLVDIDAESGPSRAAELLAGLGFSQEDMHKPTSTFSGGWRMRLSLARALFVKPDLLMLECVFVFPLSHDDRRGAGII
jgi:ATP-binding cassette subfamily F protein 3